MRSFISSSCLLTARLLTFSAVTLRGFLLKTNECRIFTYNKVESYKSNQVSKKKCNRTRPLPNNINHCCRESPSLIPLLKMNATIATRGSTSLRHILHNPVIGNSYLLFSQKPPSALLRHEKWKDVCAS